MTGKNDAAIDACKELIPFLRAAKRGLSRSRWRPGDDVNELLAPITLAILAEVGKYVPSEYINA